MVQVHGPLQSLERRMGQTDPRQRWCRCVLVHAPSYSKSRTTTKLFKIKRYRSNGREEGDGWAALSLSRVTKGHVFDKVAQLHKRREMEGLDKVAVGPQREGLRPIPGISGAGDDHDPDVRALGDGLDMA